MTPDRVQNLGEVSMAKHNIGGARDSPEDFLKVNHRTSFALHCVAIIATIILFTPNIPFILYTILPCDCLTSLLVPRERVSSLVHTGLGTITGIDGYIY